jgi:sugar phosphate isomerase/epimerase
LSHQTAVSIDLARFGFNTVTISGTLEHKLRCMKAAGFSGVELWARDLVSHPGGVREAAQIVKASGLKVTDFQPLRDFEGAPDTMRAQRLDMAGEQLSLMKEVGADLLLVCSTTNPLAIDDPDRAAEDLCNLAALAAPLGIRICYEALSWGRNVDRWFQAWDIVKRCGRDDVGLNLDWFHMSVRGDDTAQTLAQLAELPVDKIFLVQLADYFHEYGPRPADIIELARHQRLFPGEGLHGSKALVRLLERLGYRGHYTFEVFNDDYVNSDPMAIAQRGMKSAHGLAASISPDQRQHSATTP